MRIGACIGIGLIVVALAGCAPADTPVSPPPTPSIAPLFASDEEALAAAEEAYAAYLAMSDEISHDGGVNPERIAPFVTEERLALELDGFRTFSEREIRTTGSTQFTTISLQRYEVDEVVFYACWDGSEVQVLDANDVDVTPELSVPARMEVTVRALDSILLVESAEVWPGSPC